MKKFWVSRLINTSTGTIILTNLINKLNSRICLLKRVKIYFSYSLRQLFYNALIRLLFEYCCTVWGNTKNENLLRLLRMQKRCARLILDASVSDNSVQRFSKLGWIPVDNITRLRKLCMMHKIINGKCIDITLAGASNKQSFTHSFLSYKIWPPYFSCEWYSTMEFTR